MATVCCCSCEDFLGTAEDFGILVIGERNNRESYHFVLRYSKIHSFITESVNVAPALIDDKYHIVSCRKCSFEIGKRFRERNHDYIAFGKEKLKYQGIILSKTDRWIEKINTDFFKDLTRFQLSDFSTRSKKTTQMRNHNGGINVPYNARNNPGGQGHKYSGESGQKTSQYLPDEYRKKDSYTNNNRKDQKVGTELQQERPDVGSSLADKISFLENKEGRWKPDQMVFELTGPNKKNWDKITEAVQTDPTGKLMKVALKILAHQDIRTQSKSTELYVFLNTMTGQCGMMTYVNTGPLAASLIQAAIRNGRGGPSWITALNDAIGFVEVITHLMQLFIDSRTNPMLPLEQLSNRVKLLLGESFTESNPVIDGWVPELPVEEKLSLQSKAGLLFEKVTNIERNREAALEVVTEGLIAKEEEYKANAEEKLKSRQHARVGIQFLNDPKRDRDYLNIPVVPDAYELLAPAPASLPKNLIFSLGRNRQESINEDDFIETETTPTKSILSISNKDQQFRSIHHYLNTHFLLNREDCLAQLRRGIASFRDQLIAELNSDSKKQKDIPNDIYDNDKQDSNIIKSPDIALLRKVAQNIARSKDNNRVYIYENVTVRNVDRVYDDIGYTVSFNIFGTNKSMDWSRSSRFMNGSLLCLSPDGTFNAESLVVATVLKGVQLPSQGNGKGWIPTVTIGIDNQNIDLFNPILSYIMIESMVFFEAYRPVLSALQNLGKNETLPFADILIGKSNRVLAPEYLISPKVSSFGTSSFSDRYAFLKARMDANKSKNEFSGWDLSAVFPDFEKINGTNYWNPIKCPDLPILPSHPELDESQKKALKLALTRRIAVIQGPPGTGKTFIGILISQILNANQNMRSKKPILFICQTNHALDQMLEHVYKFENSIVRIGGRSESNIMKGLTINAVKQSIRSSSNNRFPTRTSEEYEALDHMRHSFIGLQASLTQQDIRNSQSIPNCHLARLKVLLNSIRPNAGDVIDGLISNSQNQSLLTDVWKSCSNAAKKRASDYKISPPPWADDLNVWQGMTTADQLLMLATYAPDDFGNASIRPIADCWVKSGPTRRKIAQPQVDSDGWQVVGQQYEIVDPSSHVQDTNAITQTSIANMEGNVDDDFMSAVDENDRDLMDDFDDSDLFDESGYAFTLNGRMRGDKFSKDEQLVDCVINRPTRLDTSISDNIILTLESLQLRAKCTFHSKNIWMLTKPERESLFKLWTTLLEVDASADISRYTTDYRKAAAIEKTYNARVDAMILRSVKVIGMTTNGAAKYNTLLRELGVEIIVVEEAAEVSEASVIASFTSHLKHLILIGDQDQLKPQVSEYGIAVYNGLDVSMFERLVRMGIPYVTLSTQRRMHPEISCLITPSIYKCLHNDPSVSLHPIVRGMKDRVFFISHVIPEDGRTTAWGADLSTENSTNGKSLKNVRPIDMAGAEMSKTNSFEAKYLIRLLKYLLLNGYQASQLVVLSMYKGQMVLLKRLAKEESNQSASMLIKTDAIDSVRMTTTDNYQGEEADVVLLSLVRSNKDGQAGFVKVRNRICVALSRARHGMYVIGNFAMYEATSDLWSTICENMERRGRVGAGVTLVCPKHPESPAVVACSELDFYKSPHGGCLLPCNEVLDCQHKCSLVCHPASHEFIHCQQECLKPRPPGCDHKCKKKCWQDCRVCTVQVKKYRQFCGHTIAVDCTSDVEKVKCRSTCGIMMLCGHNCPEICHPSGHDKLRYKCEKLCERTRATCSHPCVKKCFEDCGDCMVVVERILSCGHSREVPCSMDIDDILCVAKCTKKLQCGHSCQSKCGDACDVECGALVRKTIPSCRQNPRHWIEVACHFEVRDIACQISCKANLSCGHICEGNCSSCTRDSLEVGALSVISSHISCRKPCSRRMICNHKCSGEHLCGDSKDCPPCQQPCAMVCAHRSCNLVCGVPCVPCEQPCAYECAHARCIAKCHEIHVIVSKERQTTSKGNITMSMDEIANPVNQHLGLTNKFCKAPCDKLLTCSHPCQGICGEICPSICAVCQPQRIANAIKSLPIATNVSNESDRQLLIELFCGHVFEVNALDEHMIKRSTSETFSGSPIQIPNCPNCFQTAVGTHRYSHLVTSSLNLLSPIYIKQLQQLLCTEVTIDLKNKNGGVVIQRLQSLLTNNDFLIMKSTILLLLGQAYLSIGKMNDAKVCFNDVILSSSDNNIIREAYISLGIYHMFGGDDINTIRSTRIEKLLQAIQCFCDAEDIIDNDDDNDIKTMYSRTNEELAKALRSMRACYDSRKKEADAKAAAKALKLEEFAKAAKAKKEQEEEGQKAAASPSSATSPSKATPTTNTENVSDKSGGSALHAAARRGNVSEIKGLLLDGADPYERDSLGNTALLCAVENGKVEAILTLAAVSPWHTVNDAKKTLLEMLLDTSGSLCHSECSSRIENEAKKALADSTSNPSQAWAAAKYFESCVCEPMDKLMDMTGLRSVKVKVLELFHMTKKDLDRPKNSRISSKSAMNFMFLGNPGSGKTTVGRLLGEILASIGLRESGKFIETSGQRLIQDGSSKFPALLKSATPGVLFVDEVYQLDPKGTADGKAITNMIMEATENDRDKLTVIVAGYRDDVREKWVSFNPGIASRFPIEITFEDFNENELYTIFCSTVQSFGWMLERFRHSNGSFVNIAKVAAKRLVRNANRKGFANARSVRVMVEQAMRVASIRQKSEQIYAISNGLSLSKNHSTTLTLPDVIGSPIDVNKSPLVKELMSLTGLEDVKQSVLSLLQLTKENYESELRGEEVITLSLHRMFLGNPGTGKTTIANLYGRILKDLGYLSNGEVIIVGASLLIGDVVGSTQKKVNELLDSVKGKVLVIDEAYVLARSTASYGREAIDTLVERVQGGPSEDFAVILCGYEDEMKAMLRDTNPGLARRFRSEDAFRFADYDDKQLTTIMLSRSVAQGLYISPSLAKNAVDKVLAKQRAKPNFGNVGAINNLLDHAKERMMKREIREKMDGRWVVVASDLYEELPEDSALNALDKLVNADNIIQHIQALQKRVKVQLNKGTDPKKLIKNYVFVGPPGTGKTTVARAFGEVFHGLGLLSSNEVVECKAMELIGGYVGQSSGIMKQKMDEARGGVLFIDEAYGLDPSRSAYAKDSLDMLLANMTDPKYEGNMVIILAGYTDDIDKLLRSNPGLKRRITERLEFRPWSSQDCLHLLEKLVDDEEQELSHDLHCLITQGFTDLSLRDGWGNAGDVITIHQKMSASRENRCDDSGNIEGSYSLNDVQYAFQELLRQRPDISASKMPSEDNASTVESTIDINPLAQEYCQEIGKDMFVTKQSDAIDSRQQLNTFEEDQEAFDEDDLSDDELHSSLDEALAEMGYSIYIIQNILQSQNLPEDLINLVSKKLNRKPEKVVPMLVKQCPILLPRVKTLIKNIEKELEVQRKVREAIEKADAAEKERLKELEKMRQEAAVLERVKYIGRCPVGYEWIKCDGGYRCAGGSHYVSDAQVKAC